MTWSPIWIWPESVSAWSTADDVPAPNGSSALAVVSGVFRTTVVVPGIDGNVVLPPPFVVPLIPKLKHDAQSCPKFCWLAVSSPARYPALKLQESLSAYSASNRPYIVSTVLSMCAPGPSNASPLKFTEIDVVPPGAPAGRMKKGLI